MNSLQGPKGDTGEMGPTGPIGLSTIPTPVIIHTQDCETRLVVFTKFLSWLTAALLAAAVVVSLWNVTSERASLREQLNAQNSELTCRAAANVDVSRATAIRDNIVAQALIYVGQNNDQGLIAIIPDLQVAKDNVDVAINAQEAALRECVKS